MPDVDLRRLPERKHWFKITYILKDGPMTKQEIADEFGLTVEGVNSACHRLKKECWLESCAMMSDGRPTTGYRLTYDAIEIMEQLGIDIGERREGVDVEYRF